MILALALLIAAPQADWPYFGGTAPGDTGVAVNPASIKRDGDNRLFSGRMTRKGEEAHRRIDVEMRADCKARTLFITHARAYQDEKLMMDREEPNGGHQIDDADATTKTVDFVCAR